MESAQDIRVVLTSLAERMSVVLKEEGVLKKAMTRLMNPKRSGNEEVSEGER